MWWLKGKCDTELVGQLLCLRRMDDGEGNESEVQQLFADPNSHSHRQCYFILCHDPDFPVHLFFKIYSLTSKPKKKEKPQVRTPLFTLRLLHH